MADITIDTTGYWGDDNILVSGSFSALVFGDTVTINSGAICTIDPAQQTPTGIDVGVSITCISGFSKLKIYNSSTSTPCIFYGEEAGTFRFESGCEFEIEGDYINIYTADGTIDQTTSGWTTNGYNAADEPAVLEVETGSGTGVYEEWINCGDLSLATVVGVGSIGKFFSYNNSTGVITFGDGGTPEDLAYDASQGNSYIDVTDASNFSASDVIHIVNDNGMMRNSISSISTGGGQGGSDRINLDTNLDSNYTTATNSFVRLHIGGAIPANGANVRVFNIGVGSKNSGGTRVFAGDPANDFQADFTFGGKCVFSKCYFFGAYLYLYGAESVDIDYMGSVREVYLRQLYGITIDNLTICVDRYDTRGTQYGFYIPYGGVFNSVFTNLNIARDITYVLSFSNTSNLTFNGGFVALMNRSSAAHRAIRSIDNSYVVFDSVNIVGLVSAEDCNNISFLDCPYSDSHNSTTPGSVGYSFNLSNGSNNLIDGLLFISEGRSTSYTNGDIIGSGLTVKNTNYPSRTRWFFNMQNNSFIINSHVGSPTDYPWYSGGGFKNNRAQNITTDGFSLGVSTTLPSASVIKGQDHNGTSVDTTPGWVVDTHFYELRTAVTTGIMGIFFCPKSPEGTGYVQSGANDIKWNLNGNMYIVSAGGYIEYTWPHWVLGITEFPSGGSVAINGSGTGNFTVQYQIDVGSGWNGTWLTLNHTNLSSHSIDPDIGFRFKLKISHSAGSSSDYLNRLNWTTTVDYSTYKYPEEVVDITLQNVKDGSRYWVYNSTTDKLIATGLQSGSSDIEIPDVPYGGSTETLLIRVRKGDGGSSDYKPLETNASLTENGAIVWISQILNEITV